MQHSQMVVTVNENTFLFFFFFFFFGGGGWRVGGGVDLGGKKHTKYI